MSNKKTSREKILETATKLFHLKGYHATGLNQILQESGAPKGSLYYHFPNGKEQLALEAIHLSSKMISETIERNLATCEDPVEAFQYHIDDIAQSFLNIDQKMNLNTVPLGLLAMETAFVNENLRKACEETFRIWESHYYNKLKVNGYNEERANLISRTISALIEGSVTLCFTKKSNKPLQQMNEMIPLLLTR